ncbi:nijmegen breakage syndrome 1 protein isoform X4 [Morus notabilis]|uniref:nijmegen breakage syndrome 1 protein isoform X4 n=1 Tax=Morus notabilis TaxID=981085 RepID=UPI000CED4BD5|nr:nijmegen breakage syndrome 1 protein isoform X4 [Morus notabilis]
MVLGLFPVDPLSGENKYYIFAKGTYKVGRKGCDVIITKDKGVSRVHAEIFVDEMSSSKSSSLSCKIRIKDLSKYGTFINKNLGSMEKVHEFPNKETTLADGNLLSFGTGNASYKLSFIPLVFWVYTLEPNQVNHPLQDKLSSIGAHITYNFSQECTHVLIEELMPVREDLLDAIVAKKACVCSSWIESVAEEKIRTEIPSCSSHTSTLMVEGVSVKLADPRTRENCLEGYTFVLDSINMQIWESVAVPIGNQWRKGSFRCRVYFNQPIVVSSSCSTDETIVADSEAEDETATSVRETAAAHSREVVETVNKVEAKEDCAAPNYVATFRPSRGSVPLKREADTESESGNLDVVCSQHLIVRDTSTRTAGSTANNEAINFKRFRKRDVQSGNSFNNLIPFSKNPYKGSDDGNEEMIESAKEEKRRKQMEAMAEDLFNNVKGRRRGVAGSIHGLLTNAY